MGTAWAANNNVNNYELEMLPVNCPIRFQNSALSLAELEDTDAGFPNTRVLNTTIYSNLVAP